MLNGVEALREATVQDNGLAQFLLAHLLHDVSVLTREEYLVRVFLVLDGFNEVFDLADALVDGVLTLELLEGLQDGRVVEKLTLKIWLQHGKELGLSFIVLGDELRKVQHALVLQPVYLLDFCQNLSIFLLFFRNFWWFLMRLVVLSADIDGYCQTEWSSCFDIPLQELLPF